MKPEDLLQPLLPNQKCTLGCPVLDRFLGGGVPCSSVTEFVSESCCGKTQICLQLLLSAQLPPSLGGLSASSLYLHSEFPFPLRRLYQLSLSFPDNTLERIFVQPLHTADHLFDVLLKLDSVLSKPKDPFPIKLIVIDSIAALFRSEFDNTAAELKRRSSLFFKISSKLRSLATKYGLTVVVTNQVVDVVGPSNGLNGMRVGNLRSMESSGRRVCPALGLSWANCVNSRIFLSRDEEVVKEECGAMNGDVGGDEFVRTRTRRRLHVVFSPHLPESECEYVIMREGVFGVDR